MLDIFSMLQCSYCTPDQNLELFSLSQSETEVGTRINQGIIYCLDCTRFYIIRDEIVFLSQDGLRDQQDEINFLLTWQEQLPDKIIYQARPYNLDSFN